MLVDLMIDGRERKVLMQANKNAFYYVIDRVTGAFISAQPFARSTWASGIDQETGRPNVHPEAFYGTEPVTLSPSAGGAHNWSPMSYNPDAGLVYIPTTTSSSFTFAAVEEFDPVPGQTTGTVRPAPPSNDPGRRWPGDIPAAVASEGEPCRLRGTSCSRPSTTVAL